MMLKCGKDWNKKASHEPSGECVTDVQTHFDDIRDLLLNWRTTEWNLCVL